MLSVDTDTDLPYRVTTNIGIFEYRSGFYAFPVVLSHNRLEGLLASYIFLENQKLRTLIRTHL
jgi:hypothetical protein